MSSATQPHCWGIGLGRTGTNSLCEALRLLGYERVEHNPPFERLASLDGGADNGVLLFYKYLDYKFPNSKFVLMLRPLEDWLHSMEFAASPGVGRCWHTALSHLVSARWAPGCI